MNHSFIYLFYLFIFLIFKEGDFEAGKAALRAVVQESNDSRSDETRSLSSCTYHLALVGNGRLRLVL